MWQRGGTCGGLRCHSCSARRARSAVNNCGDPTCALASQFLRVPFQYTQPARKESIFRRISVAQPKVPLTLRVRISFTRSVKCAQKTPSNHASRHNRTPPNPADGNRSPRRTTRPAPAAFRRRPPIPASEPPPPRAALSTSDCRTPDTRARSTPSPTTLPEIRNPGTDIHKLAWFVTHSQVKYCHHDDTTGTTEYKDRFIITSRLSVSLG